jgi:hypothetical protein
LIAVQLAILFIPASKFPLSIISLLPFLQIFFQKRKPVIDAKGPFKGFITNFKALICLLTINCILGVDFLQFPRELAKTETYGISLMDLGVGAIVFSMGLTGSRFFTRPLGTVIRSSILVGLIGVLRTVVVKLTGYHVSVIS